jgi:hypothetical protein
MLQYELAAEHTPPSGAEDTIRNSLGRNTHHSLGQRIESGTAWRETHTPQFGAEDKIRNSQERNTHHSLEQRIQSGTSWRGTHTTVWFRGYNPGYFVEEHTPQSGAEDTIRNSLERNTHHSLGQIQCGLSHTSPLCDTWMGTQNFTVAQINAKFASFYLSEDSSSSSDPILGSILSTACTFYFLKSIIIAFQVLSFLQVFRNAVFISHLSLYLLYVLHNCSSFDYAYPNNRIKRQRNKTLIWQSESLCLAPT